MAAHDTIDPALVSLLGDKATKTLRAVMTKTGQAPGKILQAGLEGVAKAVALLPKSPQAQSMADARWKGTTAASRRAVLRKVAQARWADEAAPDPPPRSGGAPVKS